MVHLILLLFPHHHLLILLQTLESEADIALCLADKFTKVVLAGDYMQVLYPIASSQHMLVY